MSVSRLRYPGTLCTQWEFVLKWLRLNLKLYLKKIALQHSVGLEFTKELQILICEHKFHVRNAFELRTH